MDVVAQCASLANDFGSSKGPNAAAVFNLELWIGDPNGSGVEVPSSAGYAPVSVTNNGTNFPPADPTSGVLTTPIFTFPTSTAEYPDAVTHWVLRAATGGAVWQTGQLADDQRITVSEAGVTPRLTLAIFYNPIGV